MILKHKLIKQIDIKVRSGENRGKTGGTIIYRDLLPSYYLTIKLNKQDHVWRNPFYTKSVNLSKDIIEKDLKPRKVEFAVFLFVGIDRSFFIIVKIKEFEKGRLTEFDDIQYQINFEEKKKFYSEKELFEELENEDNTIRERTIQSTIQN